MAGRDKAVFRTGGPRLALSSSNKETCPLLACAVSHVFPEVGSIRIQVGGVEAKGSEKLVVGGMFVF